MQRHAVFGGVARGGTSSNKATERLLSLRLAIEVRTGCPPQETEPIVQRSKSSKRVSDSALKPAQHAGADATQDSSSFPGTTQQSIESMSPPHGKHVGSITTPNIKDVLSSDEGREILGLRWPAG